MYFFAVGGASEWSEAAEGSAEEAAASDEGEGPAAERAQPRRAGSQQTGGALPRAAEAQQDLKGTSAPLMSALHAVVEARFLIWDTEVDICCWFFLAPGVVTICGALQEVTSAGTNDQPSYQSSRFDLLKTTTTASRVLFKPEKNIFTNSTVYKDIEYSSSGWFYGTSTVYLHWM